MTKEEKKKLEDDITNQYLFYGGIIAVIMFLVGWFFYENQGDGGWWSSIFNFFKKALTAAAYAFLTILTFIFIGSGVFYLRVRKIEREEPFDTPKKFKELCDSVKNSNLSHLSTEFKERVERIEGSLTRLTMLLTDYNHGGGQNVNITYKANCDDMVSKVANSIVSTNDKWLFWYKKKISNSKLVLLKEEDTSNLCTLSKKIELLTDKTEDLLINSNDNWDDVEEDVISCINLAVRIKSFNEYE